jgi:ribulose-phosphate 3-epimerase
MPGKISVSMMCADICLLGGYLESFKQIGIEYLHIDVMDGVFVPNLQLGTDYIKQLRSKTDIPLDIHLMVDKPEGKIEWFDLEPGEYASIHYESTAHTQRALAKIKEKGAKAMLALNPATPLCVLEDVIDDLDAVLIMTVNPGFAGQALIPQTISKIARLKKLLVDLDKAHIEIEVDGNVSFSNAKKMRDAGADIFVAGTSSVFAKGMTPEAAAAKLRENIRGGHA